MEETLITYVLCSAINYFSMHIFLSSLTNVELKMSLKKVAVILICFWADITAYFFYGNNKSIITIIACILIEITMGYIHESNIKRCLIISIIMAIIQCVCDAVVAGVFLGIVHQKIEYIYSNTVIYMLANMLYQLLFLLVAIFMHIYFKKHKMFIRDNGFWKTMIVMALGSIYVFSYLIISSSNNPKLKYVECVVCIVVVFAMNIILFLFYDRLCTDLIIQEERDNLLRYVELQELEQKNVDTYNKKISKIKHDMNNYLIGVKTLIDTGKYEDAVKEIDRVNKNLSEVSKLIITNDSTLNYILNAKLWSVNNNHIKFVTDIYLDSEIIINPGDLSVVIGNAIDNAVEYLTQHREAEQLIDFKLLYQHGIFSMKIVNEVLEDIEIPENMIIRSTKNSEMHGFGIGSIKEIVDKYEGDIIIKCSNKKFCMELSMILEVGGC